MSDIVQRYPLPTALRRYWLWTLMLTLLSAAYSVAMTRILHARHPYGLNLVFGSDRWWDFLVFQNRFVHFRDSSFWTIPTYPFTYPAAVGVLFGWLYRLPHPLVAYLGLCVAAALGWAAWLAVRLVSAGIRPVSAWGFALTIVALAWPLWFQLLTANIEGVVVITLSLGVIACLRRYWMLAAVLIGMAGAMKIYPLILLGLLLSARRYRAFLLALATALAVNVASLAILGPSVPQAHEHIAAGIAFVKDVFVFSTAIGDSVCNHSLFVPIKQIIARLHHQTAVQPATMWSYLDEPARNHQLLQIPYMLYMAAASVFGVAAYFLRIRMLPVLNQVLALTVCAVLLPPISLDYTLTNLLLPFGLLCLYVASNRGQVEERRPSGLLFVGFAIVFSIGTFFTVKYRLAGAVRTVALVVLLLSALRSPLPWPELDDTRREVPA